MLAYIFEHLAPSCWCCVGRIGNPYLYVGMGCEDSQPQLLFSLPLSSLCVNERVSCPWLSQTVAMTPLPDELCHSGSIRQANAFFLRLLLAVFYYNNGKAIIKSASASIN